MNRDSWNNWLGFLLGTLNGYLIYKTDTNFFVILLVVILGTIATRLLAEALAND